MSDKHEKALEKVHQELANLPRELQEGFFKRFQRHHYSAHLDAQHAVRNILGFGTTTCSQTVFFILSGRDNTNGSGRVTLPIQFCGIATVDWPLVTVREPNFVATPHGATPSFLTVITRSTSQQLAPNELLLDRSGNSLSERNFLVDLSVDVMAWRGDGSPAGGIEFSWICTVEAASKMNLSG